MTNTKSDTNDSLSRANHLTFNYNDGDVIIIDHVKSIENLTPKRPKVNVIAVCYKGTMNITAGSSDLEVKAGDILFCPSNMHFDQGRASSDLECKILCLSDYIIQSLIHDKIEIWHHATYINQVNVISMSDICRQELELYYALISSKIRDSQTVRQDTLQALIRAMLLDLCHILESRPEMKDDSKPSQGKTLFNRFLKLVSSSHVKRQPITHYASQLAITPKYLTMLCLKYSDKTASDWIVQYTIEDIRFFLRNSNLSIKEISSKLGFANMSHFGSYTRKHLGASPTNFRHRKQN